jgi:hypothetical protein
MWRVSHPAKDEHMLARGSRREQAPLNFGKVLSDAAVAGLVAACFNSFQEK